MGHSLQQVMRGDHESGRAEPALHGACLDERALHGAAIEPLDRHHRAAVGLPAEDQARADQCTIQVHGARATLALLARVLGPVQAESLAEHVEETLAAPHIVGDTLLPVDGAADPQSPSGALRAPPCEN